MPRQLIFTALTLLLSFRPVAGRSCPVDGTFCTVPCGVFLYTCAGGTRLTDQPLATGTVCFDPGNTGKATVRGRDSVLLGLSVAFTASRRVCLQGRKPVISVAPLLRKQVRALENCTHTSSSPKYPPHPHPTRASLTQPRRAQRRPLASRLLKCHPFQTQRHLRYRRRSLAHRRARQASRLLYPLYRLCRRCLR